MPTLAEFRKQHECLAVQRSSGVDIGSYDGQALDHGRVVKVDCGIEILDSEIDFAAIRLIVRQVWVAMQKVC